MRGTVRVVSRQLGWDVAWASWTAVGLGASVDGGGNGDPVAAVDPAVGSRPMAYSTGVGKILWQWGNRRLNAVREAHATSGCAAGLLHPFFETVEFATRGGSVAFLRVSY